MRATFLIPDPLYRALKQCAAKRGAPMSEVATEMTRKGLGKRPKPKGPFRFRTFKLGGTPKINVANREELYDFLEAERDERL
jgi:hypothetical protein